MVDRIRDIHGRWATPEQAEAVKAEVVHKYAAQYPWEAPKPIWDDGEGRQLCRFLTQNDLNLLAHHGGGCCPQHFAAAGQLEIEHLMAFLDPEGRPSCVIYAVDVEWWGKPHADIPRGQYSYGTHSVYQPWGYTQNEPDRFRYNTYVYGNSSASFKDDVMIDGHLSHLIEVHNGNGSAARFAKWYEQARVPR